MGGLVPQIPLQFLNAGQKFAVIDWIRSLMLPSRFARDLFQQWADAVNYKPNGTDYELVTRKGTM